MSIDPASRIPLYAQIVEQVQRGIASGNLRRGDVLPSRRDLSVRLEISPLTVLKAYDELEALGLIQVKQGLGTFVAVEREQAVEEYATGMIEAAIDSLVEDAQEFHVPLERILSMVHEKVDRIRKENRQMTGEKSDE